ncbi:hypothetical protein D3C71_2219360 [compost metagenome]
MQQQCVNNVGIGEILDIIRKINERTTEDDTQAAVKSQVERQRIERRLVNFDAIDDKTNHQRG